MVARFIVTVTYVRRLAVQFCKALVKFSVGNWRTNWGDTRDFNRPFIDKNAAFVGLYPATKISSSATGWKVVRSWKGDQFESCPPPIIAFRNSETESWHYSIRKCTMPIGQRNEDLKFAQ